METQFISAAKDATRRILTPVYGTMEDIVKQAVNSAATDNAISWRLDRLTKSHQFSQNIVDRLTRSTIFTTPNTKLDKIYHEQAVMNEIKLCEPSTNVRKGKRRGDTTNTIHGKIIGFVGLTQTRRKEQIEAKEGRVALFCIVMQREWLE